MPKLKARLVSLAVLVIVALVLGCSSDDRNDGSTGPAGSASPQESTSTSPIASPPSSPSSTQMPISMYPAGTRTSVESIDAVVSAMEKKNSNDVANLIQTFPIPCGQAPPAPRVGCEAGEIQGTPTAVFLSAGCEGMFLRPTQENVNTVIQGFLADLDPRVYAVAEEMLDIPGSHRVVFATGHSVLIDDGITGFYFPCGELKDMFLPGTKFVLPPL